MTGVTAPIFIHPSRPHRHGGRPDASLAVAGGAKCPEGRATAGVRRVKIQTGEAASKPRPFVGRRFNNDRTKRAPSRRPLLSLVFSLPSPRFVLCLFCLLLTTLDLLLRSFLTASRKKAGPPGSERVESPLAVNLDLSCCHQSTTGRGRTLSPPITEEKRVIR